MRQWALLISKACLILILMLVPVAAQAVDWTEGFEYANDAAMRAVWSASQTDCTWGGPTPSSTRAHTGAKSDKQTYRGVVGTDVGAGGCYMTRDPTARSEQLYARWWMYLDAFTTGGGVGTKITRHEDTLPGYPGVWWNISVSGYALQAHIEGIILDGGTQDTAVVSGGVIPQNQWVCMETYLAMGTPGVDDGTVRAWINGTQVINKTNQRMRAATLNQQNGPNVKFGRVKLYTQHGLGVIYYDDYAVSRDARIGCPAGGSDTTAPATPTGWLLQ